jgi:hypothetical protein
MTVSGASELIGEAALLYYRKRAGAKLDLPVPDVAVERRG